MRHLEQAADASLSDASMPDVLETVRQVLELEFEFWEMAWPRDWTRSGPTYTRP